MQTKKKEEEGRFKSEKKRRSELLEKGYMRA